MMVVKWKKKVMMVVEWRKKVMTVVEWKKKCCLGVMVWSCFIVVGNGDVKVDGMVATDQGRSSLPGADGT